MDVTSGSRKAASSGAREDVREKPHVNIQNRSRGAKPMRRQNSVTAALIWLAPEALSEISVISQYLELQTRDANASSRVADVLGDSQ